MIHFGSLFLQSGFADAVFHYMRAFCRDFVVNFAVDFSVHPSFTLTEGPRKSTGKTKSMLSEWNSSRWMLCRSAVLIHFGTKKVHGFWVRMPICQMVPISFGCCQRTTARKTPATFHGMRSWRWLDQELTNFWATLCTKSCPSDFVLFFSYQEGVQNPAGKKLAKSWTWVANF